MLGTNNVLGGGGFHHVAIRVKNFDASVKFYTEVLGFKKSITWGEENKRAIMLDTGDGNCLEVFAGETVDNKPEGNYLHLAFRTTKCDAVIQTIKTLGMEVTMDPTDVDLASTPPTPVRIAFFKGLDGELIELFQNR